MKKISIIIVLIISLTSCEDVLDLTPKNSLSDADFWANETTIQGYVDYAYHMMTEYTSSQNPQSRPMSWGHFRGEATDEAFAHIPWGGGLDLTKGTLNPSTRDIIGGWVDNYRNIQHINVFFENYEAGRFDVPQEKLDIWLGEMHFLRAYCYNQMVQSFGGVIIADKPFTPEIEVTQVRASYDESVAFILTEIEESLKGLPPTATAGRATHGAALGLKSKLLLHAASPLHNPSNDQGKWNAAAVAAKAVIDYPEYSLYNPTTKYIDVLYDTPSAGNTEIMLAKYVNGDQLIHFFNYSSTLFGPPSFGGWGLGTPIQALVDDFQMADGTSYDRDVHGATPYENREVRFYANILYDGAPYSTTMARKPSADEVGIKIESGTYKEIVNGAEVTRPGYDRQGGVLQETKNFTRTGYYCHKYVKDDITSKFQVGVPSQYVLMRLTEFYLNYAECLVMLDRGAEARDYILPIRRRVDLPDESLPATLTMDDIMHERRIEMAFEGQRFFDVRRWKILDQTFKDAYKVDVANDRTVEPATATYTYSKLQTRTFDEKLYYMPIPQSEINKNPLIEQNPGWN